MYQSNDRKTYLVGLLSSIPMASSGNGEHYKEIPLNEEIEPW
jgi:hypothetical protein